ncbi:MAG: ACT domain-containing protein [Saccharofermentans sp.]|nr:ACT domain-containing protein [Saccharofermentans sp.]
MKLIILDDVFTVCKVDDVASVDLSGDFVFVGKTKDEISVVCPVKQAPSKTTEREDGWRGFRIEGVLDFSLIGILAKISAALADNNIGIFAVSTYNTDYIFVKEKDFDAALSALVFAGYDIG